jgi:hypothetical protein
MFYLISAILYLSPGMPHETVKHYADLIHFEAKWYRVDPMVVLAVIQIESGWKAKLRSVTNDYGLMQVHVARHGSADFYRREKELYDPRVNIREGIRILAMWREYHTTWCHGPHAYWAHYKWGLKVKNDDHARRVKALTDFLRKKYKRPPLVT